MSFKERIQNNEMVLGAFLSEIPAPNLTRLMQAAGLDYVVVDCEHGYFDYSQVAALAAVAGGVGFPLIVRAPHISRECIQKYLDAGVDGILIPMLNTPQQAEELVRFGKYAPQGERGISTMRPHSNYNPGKLSEYTQKANGRTMFFAQIETVQSVENAQRIAAVDGIDGLFVGPNDLACALGCTGNFDTPEMEAALAKVVAAGKAAGKPTGVIASNPAFLRHWQAQGMTLFSCDSELGLLKKGIQAMIKDVKGTK
ncbi:HpcH/HpaI aldolase family protein [Vermiculatibacterium agrestimuris]|uniref:HpcH/HpaI aldolase family protein n=1 Tax=Vermiculatibacterium agrestimuris TaxID=2941519 RepID=UPI00203FE495|nr:aldolase/citrate lyase family protein [Vermiculatibacterium agrestimuris]